MFPWRTASPSKDRQSCLWTLLPPHRAMVTVFWILQMTVIVLAIVNSQPIEGAACELVACVVRWDRHTRIHSHIRRIDREEERYRLFDTAFANRFAINVQRPCTALSYPAAVIRKVEHHLSLPRRHYILMDYFTLREGGIRWKKQSPWGFFEEGFCWYLRCWAA